MTDRTITSTGMTMYENRQHFDTDRISEWDAQTPEQRIEELSYSILMDILEDVPSDHDALKALSRNMKFCDANGNTFSYAQLSLMTSTELILRGIIK